jgi:DNA repair exonuclease SbcCD ATPase subunit
MKAVLHLKNIGGLREGKYDFFSDKLNIIESANSGGKTSTVKALVGVLSIPPNGIINESIFEEAQKLGIKTDPRNPYEGFVNVHADQASVELDFNQFKENYLVKQNGEIIVAPKNGDERFLLTGILSNSSRVLRQLRGLDTREADDFKWAVEELSNAQRYSQIIDTLVTEKENLTYKKESINKALVQLTPLATEEVTLGNKISAIDKEIDILNDELSITKEVSDKRKKLQGRINDLGDKIQKDTIILDKKIKEENINLSQIKEKEDLLIKNNIELKEMEDKLIKLRKKENRKQVIDTEINALIDQRNIIDGLLNLYVVAEMSLKNQKNEMTCPLCKEGHIDYSKVVDEISNYRKERNNINTQIINFNQEKQSITFEISETEKNIEKIKEDIRNNKTDINTLNKFKLGQIQDEIKSIKSSIETNKKNLNNEKENLDKLNKEFSPEHEEIKEKYEQKITQRNELHQKIGSVRQQISSLSTIELYNNIIPPEIAQEICEEILNVINERINYLNSKADEEREQAAKKFNENINELMGNLRFTEFRTIKLSGAPSYRLYVERYDPTKKDYKSQEVGTLSTSEKLAIALILQIALKETYMKKLPFLILDDVLEGFDPERYERVIEYLQKKVKQEEWFIIATRLVDNVNTPRVTYFE